MGEYINVVETFGCDVFNDSVMQARLPISQCFFLFLYNNLNNYNR